MALLAAARFSLWGNWQEKGIVQQPGKDWNYDGCWWPRSHVHTFSLAFFFLNNSCLLFFLLLFIFNSFTIHMLILDQYLIIEDTINGFDLTLWLETNRTKWPIRSDLKLDWQKKFYMTCQTKRLSHDRDVHNYWTSMLIETSESKYVYV